VEKVTLRKYEVLGPFEIKKHLAKLAAASAQAYATSYLNAGRGNPSWISNEPR
jgi:aspartate 4-decarboxylase